MYICILFIYILHTCCANCDDGFHFNGQQCELSVCRCYDGHNVPRNTSASLCTDPNLSTGTVPTPSERSAQYHNEYIRISTEWEQLDLTYNNGTCFCTSEFDKGNCTQLSRSKIEILVSRPPPLHTKGCAPVVTFYEQLNSTNNDAGQVQRYCDRLMSSVRITRAIYHAYIAAWTTIQYGDGTLPRGQVSARIITHRHVLLQIMRMKNIPLAAHIAFKNELRRLQAKNIYINN